MKPYALVLGGGGAKAFAHLGIRDVLKQENLMPSLIVSSSMGSLFGYFIAKDIPTQDVKDIFYSWMNRLKWLKPHARLNGILSQSHMRNIIKRFGDVKINQLPIPMRIIATDIVHGKLIVFEKELASKAIIASAAFPGIYPAVPYKNTLLIDGGVLNNVPADIAKQAITKQFSQGKVITVSLEGKWDTNIDSYRLVTNMMHRAIYLPLIVKREEIAVKYSDLVLKPFKNEPFTFKSWRQILSFYSVQKMEYFYNLGRKEAQKNIKKIKEILE